ncbi:MAG: polysaccharide deacetylase family protein [Chloroflexi bacterium]|nr:polysaccharide deacetylase family protein [Chloroflexota bacterium]
MVHVIEDATESDRRLDMEEPRHREAARYRQTPAGREVAVSDAVPTALILMYHRVADVSTDPHLLCVSPRRFAEQLEILRKHARPMRLHDLEQALSRGDVPPWAVVVTFDDGYADTLLDAKPLLERYDIPSTAFVTSGYLGSGGEFWWDELDRLVLGPKELPETPRIGVEGRLYEWSLGEAARYTEAAFRQHRGWDLEREEDPTPRQRLHRALHALILPLAEEERRDVLAQPRVQTGGSSPAGTSRRTLSSEEVVALAEGGLIEIGSHSVTHTWLPSLPTARQRDEIGRSKADLESVLGRPWRASRTR